MVLNEKEHKVQIHHTLKTSIGLIGLAAIGIMPSDGLTTAMHQEMLQIKTQDGALAFPESVKRLANLKSSVLPSQDLCRAACKEIDIALKPLNQEAREHAQILRQAAAPTTQMRPTA